MNPATVEAVRLLRWLGERIGESGNAKIAAACHRTAQDLETYERITAGFRAEQGCVKCGADVEQLPGRSGPRKYCTTCSPRKSHGRVPTEIE